MPDSAIIKRLKAAIIDIPDFPKPGIMYRDITGLLNDATAFIQTIYLLRDHYQHKQITKVLGIEARGFIFAAPLAYELQVGFIPIRKANKLPRTTLQVSYQLEYGSDLLEIHHDALQPDDHILIIDDLLATGGTMQAAIALVEQSQAHVEHIGVVIELSDCLGRQKLTKYNADIFSLLKY